MSKHKIDPEALFQRVMQKGGPVAKHLQKLRSFVSTVKDQTDILIKYENVEHYGKKIDESYGQFTGGGYHETWVDEFFVYEFFFFHGALDSVDIYSKELWEKYDIKG